MSAKKIWKITSNVITVILFLLLIFMIFVVVSSKAAGGEPQILGYQLKTVLSGSMEPTFKTGSIIAIKPLKNPTDLKKDDVITFMESNDILITHRITEVIKNDNQVMYKTKGDNNEDVDANPVVSQNVIGKYNGFTIPNVGYFLDYAKTKNGTALLLIIPGVFLLAYSGISITKGLKDLKDTTKSSGTEKTI